MALTGLEGTTVLVEAAVSQQLPGIAIIGLPDAALNEAKQRVRSATTQIGLPLTKQFLTLNLSPASLPKQGSGFDLAIALAGLAASGHLPTTSLASTVHLGELGLDGELRRPHGLLSAVLAARQIGFERVMVPALCGREAALVPGIEVIAVQNLRGAVAWHRGEAEGWLCVGSGESPADGALAALPVGTIGAPDVADVIGQPEAVQALAVAAAGRHHLSLLGPPGSGKTLLASRLPTVLPDLTEEESIETSSIASLGGVPLMDLVSRPPFERPHHSASSVAIIGGGDRNGVRPGAVTRACHGILFMDEAPEFSRKALDGLREPLEMGTISIQRAQVRVTLPARVQLILASNPCPCGLAGSVETALQCRCSPLARVRYLDRLSGPLTDRIDLRITVRRVSSVLLAESEAPRRGSAEIRKAVETARASAAERWRNTPWRVNSEVPGERLRDRAIRLPRADTAVIDRALGRGALTLRGYDRTLRVAWSIADLEGKSRPGRSELGQALAMRLGSL